MGALKAVVVAMLVVAAPARADDVVRWRAFSAEAAARFGLPVGWIERVMRLESAGQTSLDGKPITSRKGAMGLMQLMPETWAAMRAAYGLGRDPYDPRDNILAGAAYLRLMYDRFGYPGLFGAYNAGPARYAAYLRGLSLPMETRSYLARSSDGAPAMSAAAMPPRSPAMFAVRTGSANVPVDGPLRQAPVEASLLFAIRKN